MILQIEEKNKKQGQKREEATNNKSKRDKANNKVKKEKIV